MVLAVFKTVFGGVFITESGLDIGILTRTEGLPYFDGGKIEYFPG